MDYIASRYPGRAYAMPNYPSSTPGRQGATPMFNQTSDQKWHPTVVYLVGLIVVEIFALGLLRQFTS